MPTTRSSFKQGNAASKGVKNKPGRPPNWAKMALRDILMDAKSGEGESSSLRDEAIVALQKCLKATTPDGAPSSVMLNAAKCILGVTDAADMHVGEDDAPSEIEITVRYKGGLEAVAGNLPTYAPRRPEKDSGRSKPVQRDSVRAKVRKNDPR